MLALGGGVYGLAGLALTKPIDGGAVGYSVVSDAPVTAAVTTYAGVYLSNTGTVAAPFTLGRLAHYVAQQNTIGAGSRITEQMGFIATETITGANSNYGFYSNINAGANNYNFYSDNKADSLFKCNNFIFANGGAERARFDVNGKLLIGSSVARLMPGCLAEVTGGIGTIGPLSALISLEAPAGKGFRWTLANDGTYRLQGTPDGFATPASVSHPITVKTDGAIRLGHVRVYADNTAAIAAGLVADDIYRKADGTLMIAF